MAWPKGKPRPAARATGRKMTTTQAGTVPVDVVDRGFDDRLGAYGVAAPQQAPTEPQAERVAGFDLTTVLAAIQDMMEQTVAPLREEIATVRDESRSVAAAQPQYRQTQNGRVIGTVRPKLDMQSITPDTPREGGGQWPITTDGLAVEPHVLRQYPTHFDAGDRVRLRPDVVRGGRIVETEIVRNQNGKYVKTLRTIVPMTIGERLAFAVDPESGDLTPRRPLVCDRPVNMGGKRPVKCQAKYMAGEECPRCGDGPTVKALQFLSKDMEWKYRVVVPGFTGDRGDGFSQSELLHADARQCPDQSCFIRARSAVSA